MKIALVGCAANPRVGGMGRALYDHAVALAVAGHAVTVYSLDSIPRIPVRDGASLGYADSLQNDTFTIGELRRLFSFGKAAWGARFDPPLDAYDVVHLHLPFFGVAEKVMRSFDSGSRRALAQDDKKRLFVTYHMDAIGTGLKRIYFNWWYRRRFKKVLAACDAIAVTSRAYARESQLARAEIDIEKCEEILLRVDTNVFGSTVAQGHARPTSVSEAGVPRAVSYLLFVGALDRAHYFKGLSVLFRAITEVPDARLVVVGSGELSPHYKKQAEELGIADRVTFTGGVTDEELARWYTGARALILPSTDRSEAFGIVLIEAMACGTPVIASDLPGVRAVVERVAPAGTLVPPNNIQELARALQNAWNTPWSNEERTALAARAASVYGRATLAAQLIAWYRGIITA